MSTNATNNYKLLEKKAILWDSMPFDTITFNGRVIKKYGKEYFYERYHYITGAYYKDIQAKKLDTLQKVINLGFENAQLQKHSIEEGFIPMMYVPEEYREIWKNAIPLKYFRDYKDRKLLLDSYLRTLPISQQADAIRIMCGDNETRNYLNFLDLNFETANEQQKNLFEDLVSFYEKEFLAREQEKEMLAKKSFDSANNSINELASAQNRNDFLTNREIFKKQDYAKVLQENYLASDLFTKANVQEKVASNATDVPPDSTTASQNQTLKVNTSPFDIKNRVYNEEALSKIPLSSLRTKQTPMIGLNTNTINSMTATRNNAQQLNQTFTYNEYVKNPNAYNIVDLINNRMVEDVNNKNIVNQIVKSSIYVNDYYSKALASNSNKKPISNNNNNKLAFNPLTPKLNIFADNKNINTVEPSKSTINQINKPMNQFNLNLHMDEDKQLSNLKSTNNMQLIQKKPNSNTNFHVAQNQVSPINESPLLIKKTQTKPIKLKLQNFDDQEDEQSNKIDLKKLVAVPTTRIK